MLVLLVLSKQYFVLLKDYKARYLNIDKVDKKTMILKACKSLNSYRITSAQIDDFIVFPSVGYDYFKIGPLKLLGDGSLGAKTSYNFNTLFK